MTFATAQTRSSFLRDTMADVEVSAHSFSNTQQQALSPFQPTHAPHARGYLLHGET